MKRCLLLLILLGFALMLSAQAAVTQVTVSNDYPVVTRVAIALSEKAVWSYTVDTTKHQITVIIKNCTVSTLPIEGLSSNKIITGFDLTADKTDGIAVLSVNGPFVLETMSVDEPFKIVLDIFEFKKPYSFLEYLWMAKFYEGTGQLVSASKEYSKMMQTYPNDTPGYYYWGSLLIQRNRPETAKSKLRLVAKGSKYYSAAQNLIAKLENKTLPVAEPVKTEKPPVEVKPPQKTEPEKTENQIIVLPPVAESTQAESTITPPVTQRKRFIPLLKQTGASTIKFFSFSNFFGMTWKDFLQTPFMSKLRALPFWFWLIIALIVVIAVLIILDTILNRKKRAKQKAYRQANQIASDAVKQGMVIKLIENGWNEQEIARELLLSAKETHIYVIQGKKIIKRKAKHSE